MYVGVFPSIGLEINLAEHSVQSVKPEPQEFKSNTQCTNQMGHNRAMVLNKQRCHALFA